MGMDFLHSYNIIHRDLKPQNILIKGQILKIADFGLARTYSLHSTFTTQVVTLNYRAPELLLQCNYNTSVDIWSIGCILLELYTRKPIFMAQTETQQLIAIFKYFFKINFLNFFRVIGTPSQENWPIDAAVQCSSFPEFFPISLSNLAPKASPLAIELATLILKFDSKARPTAAACLTHAYFA